jgi:hypothetical protein
MVIDSIMQAVGDVPLIRLKDNGRNRVVTVLPDRAERYFSMALL